MTSMVVIRAKYDDDARVWYVEHSDLSGVHAEGTTFDELCGKLPNVVRERVEANSGKPITDDILY